mmetsp:Transcript_44468/g.128526  ORF Transcript_44468/g.128526 Transcript_44468/m.128526 type:complete len:107 (-) Transcript_44468:322-642(-)
MAATPLETSAAVSSPTEPVRGRAALLMEMPPSRVLFDALALDTGSAMRSMAAGPRGGRERLPLRPLPLAAKVALSTACGSTGSSDGAIPSGACSDVTSSAGSFVAA